MSNEILKQIDNGAHTSWDFDKVVLWAHRLGKDIYQTVTIHDAYTNMVDYTHKKSHSVTIRFTDVNGNMYHATYAHSLYLDEAERLAAAVRAKSVLNGFYWNLI